MSCERRQRIISVDIEIGDELKTFYLGGRYVVGDTDCLLESVGRLNGPDRLHFTYSDEDGKRKVKIVSVAEIEKVSPAVTIQGSKRFQGKRYEGLRVIGQAIKRWGLFFNGLTRLIEVVR